MNPTLLKRAACRHEFKEVPKTREVVEAEGAPEGIQCVRYLIRCDKCGLIREDFAQEPKP